MTIPFNNSYAQLPDIFYSRVEPEIAPEPSFIQVNEDLAELLGIDAEWLKSESGLNMFSGKKLPDDADPIAMAYGGHQFGNWQPQLGDGRALLLGEVIGTDGIRRDIHLKGSGTTPYSRDGDGKSALGPVLREYIVSEAMATLGVPTTRALAAITTGETVQRDCNQPGGIFVRVAQSHVRVGTFQYFYGRGEDKALKTLADYIIERHYPEAQKADNPYQEMLIQIAERQASLISKWMSFGFIHGVMNTDNVQIVGETIDYGPCAFMDAFDPLKKFSSIDEEGRYAWANQPNIAQWNLARLAEATLLLLHDDTNQAAQIAADIVNDFNLSFKNHFLKVFSEKLGLIDDNNDYSELIESAFETMAENNVDFTLFFRHLTRVASGMPDNIMHDLFNDPKACDIWLKAWRKEQERENTTAEQRLDMMRKRNPIFIPRNHRIEEAIQAAEKGDFELFHKLNTLLATPFEEQPEFSTFEQAPEADEVVLKTFCGT